MVHNTFLLAIAANFIKKLRKHAVLSVRLHPTYFTIKFRVSWHTLQVRYSCFTKLIYLMPSMKIWCKDLQNLSSESFCAIQKNNRNSMRRSPRNKTTVVGYLTYISLLLPQKECKHVPPELLWHINSELQIQSDDFFD